ncbi:bifunctional metallophosphatase/5'-nucleotidase [Tessaracoccus sp. HDW20]|uniref:bifunctional metallophosphatase/5'-nucleotidase n=1 Tax=Tessaracoccus coleopterorum TaxID=2714950 RepID=UPI0018D2D53E|nr:bifunctional metallophosphatase/5'-nucleotidase [Tessaracoccus coleopterorum]NHB84780.1 bifunctional metallophosphatase/5'-nucleotidase [Tessaracoccus coleopterorum]
MTTHTSRLTAGLAATALVASGLAITTGATTATADVKQCVATNPTETVSVFGINDFHGRVIDDSKPVTDPTAYLAGRLFTPVEQARDTQGEDNVLLISSGDNIGASTFVSMITDDLPTLDILNAAGLDVSTVGNHEFDKGWSDLSGRVAADSEFGYLGANVYKGTGTTVPAPLKEYEIFEKAGVKIAVVGVVTADVPSLVSPPASQA